MPADAVSTRTLAGFGPAAAGDADTYTATVFSADDQDSQEVTVNPAAEFVVDIVNMDEVIIEGEPLSVTVALENIGQGVGTQLVTVDAGVLGAVELELTLSGGESTQETVEIPTPLQEIGTHSVTAESEDDSAQATVELRLPALPGQEAPPQDVTDDGYYEDVDSDDDFDIFDVQTFFNGFQSQAVQGHAWAYDFDDDGAVTIFDVQTMFNRL